MVEVDEHRVRSKHPEVDETLDGFPTAQRCPALRNLVGAEGLVEVERHAMTISQRLGVADERVGCELHAAKARACPDVAGTHRVLVKTLFDLREALLGILLERRDLGTATVPDEIGDHPADANSVHSLCRRREPVRGAACVGEAGGPRSSPSRRMTAVCRGSRQRRKPR